VLQLVTSYYAGDQSTVHSSCPGRPLDTWSLPEQGDSSDLSSPVSPGERTV